MFPTFYAVCSFGECLGDMKIITDNNAYDNISNIFKFETGFYLPMYSSNGQLEYYVPVWSNRTTGNFSDYIDKHNASGFIFLSRFGM